MGKSDDIADAYRFRTPMLRNVALTAPYGHNGAYPTLEGIVRHHVETAPHWTRDMARLPTADWLSASDFAVQNDRLEAARHARARDTVPQDLSNLEIAELVAFLNALTGATAKESQRGIPKQVPSKLPVE
jgi:cytochrome c peroxidase